MLTQAIVVALCSLQPGQATTAATDYASSSGTLHADQQAPLHRGGSRALAFDGIDDFMAVPPDTSMTYPGAGGWTIELWVKPVAYPADRESSIIGQESVGVDAHDPWSIRIHPTHFEFRVDGPRGGSESVRFDLTLGVWQHVACVYACDQTQDDENQRWIGVFVDGVLIERRTTGVRMESRHDPVYLGALAGSFFRGLLDDVRVWSQAMDDDRVRSAMHADIDQDDASLCAWWDFEETHGPVAIDRSPRATHAVLGKPHEASDGSAPTRVSRVGG